MSDLAVFVINLDESTDRLRAVDAFMDVQRTTFVRVAGVDGRLAPTDTVEIYNEAATMRYFGRALNGGEVGAFQSHLKALDSFLQSGAPFGLILEDDIDPDAHAMGFVNAIVNWQNSRWTCDWYVVNLGAKRQKLTTPLLEVAQGYARATLSRAHYFPMLATANLWTRAGASAFLDQFEHIDCPWDHALRRWLTKTDMGLTITPLLFPNSGADSLIDASSKKNERSQEPRDRYYRLRRMRRNWSDRLLALKHKTQNGPRYRREFERKDTR